MDPQTNNEMNENDSGMDVIVTVNTNNSEKHKPKTLEHTIYKIEKTRSTVEFLQSCLKENIISRTFKDTRNSFDLSEDEKKNWNQVTITTSRVLIQSALNKCKRLLIEQENVLKDNIQFNYNVNQNETAKIRKNLLEKRIRKFTRLKRNMAWFYIFGEINSQNDSEEKEFMFEKDVKTNLPKNFPKEITEFVTSSQSEYFGTDPKKILPNLSTEERKAITDLKRLQTEGKIVVKPADKGCGIVIMDRKDYEAEAYRQLNE